MEDPTALLARYIQDMEPVPCNLCGADDFMVISRSERFGLPIQSVICKHCGLMYLNPRPTRERYAEFYKSDYRKVVSGSDEGNDALFARQERFARRVILPLLQEAAPQFQPRSILDLGCSYGGILNALLQHYPGSQGFGLEPMVKISRYAGQRTGATIYNLLLEDFEPERQYDLILFARSLNHSLDPLGNLRKIRSMLSPQGIFVLTLDDPTSRTLRKPFERVTEMTHPYMFTPETAQAMLEKAGLQVIAAEHHLQDARRMKRHDFRKTVLQNMCFVTRPGQPQEPTVWPDYREIWARIQANEQARQRYGAVMQRWQHPTFVMRAWRKLWRTLGLW